MRKVNKWVKRLLYVLLYFVILLVGFLIYLVSVAHVEPPKPKDISSINLTRKLIDTNCYVIGNNWLRKSKSGEVICQLTPGSDMCELHQFPMNRISQDTN